MVATDSTALRLPQTHTVDVWARMYNVPVEAVRHGATLSALGMPTVHLVYVRSVCDPASDWCGDYFGG